MNLTARLLGLTAQAIDRAWGLIALDWDVSLRLAVTVGVVDGSNPNPTSSTGMAGRTNSRVVGGDDGGIHFPRDVINGSISGSQRVGNGNSDTGFGGSPLAEIPDLASSSITLPRKQCAGFGSTAELCLIRNCGVDSMSIGS